MIYLQNWECQSLEGAFALPTHPPKSENHRTSLPSSSQSTRINKQCTHRPTLPRQALHSPSISTLVMRSHNVQKTRDIFTVIATNLHEGVHLQALQEVNMPLLEVQRKLLSIAPGAIAQGYTNGSTNGVVTVIHPDLAPYVRPPQLDGWCALRDVSQMVDAFTLALPSLPPFIFFNIYSSGQHVLRTALARALQPWLDTQSVFMGDLNHVQDNSLDTVGQASPSKWGWLGDRLTTTLSRPSRILDVFCLLHPTQKTMTRTVLDTTTGLHKGSRIDYALLSASLRGWLPKVSVSVSPHTLGSDHNPVTLAKQVPPFTPPPVIVNDVLRLSALKPKQIKE